MRTCRVGAVARVQSGFAFKSAEFIDVGVRLLRNTNILPNRIYWDDLACLQASQYERYPAYQLRSGDILLSLDRPIISSGIKVARVRDVDVPALLVQRVGRLIVDETRVDPDYLYAFLQSPQFIGAISGHEQSLGVPHISPSQVENAEVLLPELAEQRQISTSLKAQLAEVEIARLAAQAQVRDAVLLRSRLLQQTFDALRDAPRKVLGEWARTTSGSTPPRGDKRYWSPAEIPWVKTGEVAFAPIAITEEAISRQALAECSLTLLPPQTILIAMYGQGKTRGQSAVLQVEATTNQACFSILPNDTWDVDFLHHWLMASYEDLRSLSEGRGGNQANLNGALLNALKIPAPDIDDQRRIVTRLKTQLTEAAAIHQAVTAQLAGIERLPQRLLAQAFAPPTTQGNVR